MPKYSVGAKVAFAEDKLNLAPEFAGRSGRVTEVYSEMQVQNLPGDPRVPTYMVLFEGENDAMLEEEDWLQYG